MGGCHTELVAKFCVTSYSKANGLKTQQVFRALTGSMDQILGITWLGDLGSAAEGLTGAGSPMSHVTHSHGWQAGAGSWHEASVALPVGLATGLRECPHNMAAD